MQQELKTSHAYVETLTPGIQYTIKGKFEIFKKLSISGNSCCQFVKAIKTVDNWKSVDLF